MSEQFSQTQAIWTIGSIFIGAVITSLATYLKDIFIDRSKQKGPSTYAAIRIVCVLEAYAEECAEVAEDDGEYNDHDTRELEREASVKTPDLLIFASDIDWKSFDANLAYRVLSLPAMIAKSRANITFAFDQLSGPPDWEAGFEARILEYSLIGLECLKTSNLIQLKYNLSQSVNDNKSTIERLTRAKDKIQAIRQEAQVTNAARGQRDFASPSNQI